MKGDLGKYERINPMTFQLNNMYCRRKIDIEITAHIKHLCRKIQG